MYFYYFVFSKFFQISLIGMERMRKTVCPSSGFQIHSIADDTQSWPTRRSTRRCLSSAHLMMKAEEFKELNEACDTLSDHSKRNAYDTLSGYTDGNYNRNRRTAPPPNYRKVYSPRAPPGMKTFDEKRHFDMHYGDGMMREELNRVERARRRAQAASGRKTGYDFRTCIFTPMKAGSGQNKLTGAVVINKRHDEMNLNSGQR